MPPRPNIVSGHSSISSDPTAKEPQITSAGWGLLDKQPTRLVSVSVGRPAPLPMVSVSCRHRLDRGGNSQLNCAPHRIAITHARIHPPGRAYLERKQPEGKSRREAIRCLKRQLAPTIINTLKATPVLT
jgi:hypothetical protein